MCEQDTSVPPTATPPGTTPAHRTSTVERGSFCLARCVCGWSGPARRSRDLARTDAGSHAEAPRPDGR
ncbi:hypothetical protein ACFY7Z_24790 [Streptomyces sp. NPDC012623]|uniref:hypothetical protein n=1 Tax=unclassified Streptomyces TaxID=2593676 RepID=UPI0036BD23E4